MYPIGQNVKTIQKRIDTKLAKGQNYEALLFSVFCFERMVKRTVNYMFREMGYPPKFINRFILGKRTNWHDLRELFKFGNLCLKGSNKGINDILTRDVWKLFDNSNSSGAMQLRNKIVHGTLPKKGDVRTSAKNMKKVIDKWDSWTSKNLGYNGTGRLLFYKSKLKIPFPKEKK